MVKCPGHLQLCSRKEGMSRGYLGGKGWVTMQFNQEAPRRLLALQPATFAVKLLVKFLFQSA